MRRREIGERVGALPADLRYHDISLSPLVLYQLNGDLLDSSGNGLHLTKLEGTTSFSQYGHSEKLCHRFDGSTSYYEATGAASLDITGDVTIAAMVNVGPPAATSGGYLIDKGSYNGGNVNNDNYCCGVLPRLYMLWRYNEKVGVGTAVTARGPVRGEWGHCTWVRTGTTAKLYTNGILTHTEDLFYAPTSGATPKLRIGRFQEIYAGYHYTGNACSIGIWGSALTDAQIAKMARHCLGR